MKIDKIALMKEIGKRIRKIRTDKGLQQNQLSKEFECVASKITNVEKGTRDPGIDFYFWFAKRMDCSLDYIILGKEDQRCQSEGSVPPGDELKKAIMALLDSFIESDDGRKYMVERQLVPVEYKHELGELMPSEIELINNIREMSYADAYDVMNYAGKKVVNVDRQ